MMVVVVSSGLEVYELRLLSWQGACLRTKCPVALNPQAGLGNKWNPVQLYLDRVRRMGVMMLVLCRVWNAKNGM